jgi:hypothetical protein
MKGAGTLSPKRGREKKKEEFTGFMENMLPGNSFPQIWVVSEKCVDEIFFKYEQYSTVPNMKWLYFLFRKQHVALGKGGC